MNYWRINCIKDKFIVLVAAPLVMHGWHGCTGRMITVRIVHFPIFWLFFIGMCLFCLIACLLTL
jgi:hypothetical protein